MTNCRKGNKLSIRKSSEIAKCAQAKTEECSKRNRDGKHSVYGRFFKIEIQDRKDRHGTFFVRGLDVFFRVRIQKMRVCWEALSGMREFMEQSKDGTGVTHVWLE